MDFINQYFNEAKNIIEKIDKEQILKMISIINKVRTDGGRLFILGVGGGAGHASHAVNDFRKIIDDLQMVIDKNKLSSEVHMICKKRP